MLTAALLLVICPQKEALAIMTIEKANTTINRLISMQRLSELVCVVVDEAHMVGDPGRCGFVGHRSACLGSNSNCVAVGTA